MEDELLISMAIQLALEELGFSQFTIATTEAEAVAAAHTRRPDLITADIRLRDGSGLRAVETIWAEGYVPTVFITATTTRVPSGFERSAVLQKPFTLERLKDTVRDVLPGAPMQAAAQ
jgi:DNA-binding response OmpR family regulator